MGRLTLLIVAAAVLGGASLKLGMNLIAGDTAAGRSEAQADVLARQIAETGQSLALASMVGEEGFVDPGMTGCPSPGTTGCAYDGGTFTVNSVRSADNREVTVTVEGRFGGAVHRVESTYSFDPMEYPGPIWLDVPYATASVATGARVSGTASDHPSRFDARKFDALGLAAIGLNRGTMASAVAGQLSRAQGALNVPTAAQWEARAGVAGPLLEDLSQRNDIVGAEGLYQSAVAAMAATDVTLTGATTVTGTQTWGARDGITRIKEGGLTVAGTLRGSGILIVEGPLVVPAGRTLTWDGIVIVRADVQLLPVQLLGDADITGSLVVAQNALPPGGHLDVTVMRGPAGMPGAPGARPSPNWPLQSPVDYPWWEHSHRFDLEPAGRPRGGHIEFARNGRGTQEAETQFWTTMEAVGSERVRLEFKHPEAHGFARFAVGLASEATLIEGSVRNGFGSLAGTSAYRTRPFPANDLRTLTVDVQSLRALRRLFDGEGTCDGGSWPFCVGRDWNRQGALSVRVVRERGNATVYDAAVYWHMQAEERAAHEAEEAAWMASIRGGTSFGTRLEMGSQASVTYNLARIVRLAEKVGFDGNEVHLLSSTSEHVSAAEMRAAAATAPPPPAAGTTSVCHGSGAGTTTAVPLVSLLTHVLHGDYPGPCQATRPTKVTICHVNNNNTGQVNLTALPGHLGHGDTIGACPAARGGDDDDD